MRGRQTATARSQRLPRLSTSQFLLLLLIVVGVIAGVKQRTAADGVLAEHRTVVAASYSGGANGGWGGNHTASESAGQSSTGGAADTAWHDASPAAESQAVAQQSGRDAGTAWEAKDAAQSAGSAGVATTAAEQDQAQVIGPFEPEAIVSALAGQDTQPQAQMTVDRDGAMDTADTGQGQQMPRVALLFLTRGPMPHEPAWRAFFDAAGRHTQGWPQPQRWPRHVVRGQLLFSAYLHASPGFRSPQGSVFAGLELTHPVKVQWGQHSVAEAERRLFIAALHDRHNRRFALLSESCVFLYPPAVVWLEAFAETRSRINACGHHSAKHRMVFRFQRDMHTDKLNVSMWRKSSQWIILNRKHAALVAGDDEINPLFVRECWVDTQHHPPHRFCVSDEHYIPTLLAAHGLDLANETDCTGGGTSAIWQFLPGKAPPAHPQTWSRPADVTAELIDQLRVPSYAKAGCNASAAIDSAARALPASALVAGSGSGGSGGNALAGINGAVDDVKSHFSQVLQQMPQPMQRLVGGMSASIMRRRMHAGDVVQQGRQTPREYLQWHRPEHSPAQHGTQQLQSQHASQDGLSGRSSVAAGAGPHERLHTGRRHLAQAWQGESWLLEDPIQDSTDGPEVEQFVRHYHALGHACPLFARKFTGAVAQQFADVARQHILLP